MHLLFPVSGLTSAQRAPAIFLTGHKSRRKEDFGFPIRLMPTTVAPSPTSEVLRFVNLASHSFSTGEK
jgi:hypothetical protein